MTDIRFLCPACGGKLAIDPKMAVKEIPCPLCKEKITPWGAETLDVRFKCVSCDAKLVVDRMAEGSSITCPKCDHEVLVPSRTRAPSAPTGPAAAPAPAPKPAAPSPPPPLTLPASGPATAGAGRAARTGTLSAEEVDFLTTMEPQQAPAVPQDMIESS